MLRDVVDKLGVWNCKIGNCYKYGRRVYILTSTRCSPQSAFYYLALSFCLCASKQPAEYMPPYFHAYSGWRGFHDQIAKVARSVGFPVNTDRLEHNTTVHVFRVG